MKKVLILAATILTAVMTQAATYNWRVSTRNGQYLYDYTGNKYTGNVTLMAYASTSTIDSAFVVLDTLASSSTGAIAPTSFSTTTMEAGTYNFFLTYEDANANVYSSGTVQKPTDELGNAIAIIFTSDHLGANGTWTTAAVPEPTSGLLLLCGLAGLALRRKKA